ncbi:hypothetical protein AX16_003379 [Volvariella volvacea WC 439]|nr:hypothetical protein AX16_003379 [Volvariella volvacea WC 439]
MPLVGLNVLSLVLSNYTLAHVDASFYQIARGLVLPFTVLTTSIHLHSHPSLFVLFSCAIITLGFFVGVLLDGSPLSITGVVFGVVSSLLTAVQSTSIKKALGVVNGSALMLSWYTNALSAIVLIPVIILLGEGPKVMDLLWIPALGEAAIAFDTQQLRTLPVSITSNPIFTFVTGSIITGTLGFLMSISCLLSIKVTSPITHMISSAMRGVLGSFLGVWLFNDIMTVGRASSIAIILLGSILYTYWKHKENQAPTTRESSTALSPLSINQPIPTKAEEEEEREECLGSEEKISLEDLVCGCSSSMLDDGLDIEAGLYEHRKHP